MFAGDLPRRALLCCMDSGEERPEDRHFDRDLATYVPEHRGELAAAILTIIRAYRTQRTQVKCSEYGGFEQWSRLVREPLIWLGGADPLDTREAIRAKNPDLEHLTAILTAWHLAYQDLAKTIGEASANVAVRNAMFALAPRPDGNPNPIAVGKFLGRQAGRIVNGLRIEPAGSRQNPALWRVRAA